VTIKNDSGAVSIDATVDVRRGAGSSGADGSIALYATGDITDTTSALLKGDSNGSLKAWSTGARSRSLKAHRSGHGRGAIGQ